MGRDICVSLDYSPNSQPFLRPSPSLCLPWVLSDQFPSSTLSPLSLILFGSNLDFYSP